MHTPFESHLPPEPSPETGPDGGLRAVLFDLDGTLLDRRTTLRSRFEHRIRRHALLYGRRAARRYVSRLVELDDEGTDPAEFDALADASLGLPPGSTRALTEDVEVRAAQVGVPAPHVDESLRALRALGLKLGLVTNGAARVQARRIDRLGLRDRFDSIVISGEAGCRKPDARIFHLCLAELGVSPSEAAYVGDHPTVDIAGARAAGMTAVWRRDPFWTEPAAADAIIDDLAELAVWARSRVRPGIVRN